MINPTTLALLIGAGEYRGHHEFEDSVADSIAGYLSGLTDDHKADLYALIVEASPPSPTFMQLLSICETAVAQSSRRFAR